MKFYAHSLENLPPDKWQPLEEHLKNVAELAACFAKTFGGDKWAYLAGLWHDLGKYSLEFQAKLLIENGIETDLPRQGRVIHSEAGGHLASLKGWKGIDRLLSWLIMGHHAGLADYSPDEAGSKALSVKMRHPERSQKILENVPSWIKDQPIPRQQIPPKASPSFFIRMLFSCLVDADFLDTERFMQKSRHERRLHSFPTLLSLRDSLMAFLSELTASAPKTKVNQIRKRVLERCVKMAKTEPSVFTLTVPTGGGKTFSSLAFALNHAVAHGKDRIIYVIPYINIIEQTARVFREIPGFEEAVLEHHSNLTTDTEEDESRHWQRLLTENWDAPIIVTTAVQFFESLYSNRPGKCRRLHNIVNSVVIFDEAQSMPQSYLRPVVFAIKELFSFYKVTPLFCTATQPVLTRSKGIDFDFKEGFDQEPIELAENPQDMSRALKRVTYHILSGSNSKALRLEELAGQIQNEKDSLLCIVNRKDDARRLFRLIQNGDTYHLSTNMCPEHRENVLNEVKGRLKSKSGTTRLVSTSLVEAGVDMDFPVVFRAMAGLDSIIQAAGRCNREGKLRDKGRVIVFLPEKQPAYVKAPASVAKEFLASSEKLNAISLPSTVRRYFKKLFWQLGHEYMDSKGILRLLCGSGMNYYFQTASERFQLIDDSWQQTVIVPYGDVWDVISEMTKKPWMQWRLRQRLQRLSINISLDDFKELSRKNLIHHLSELDLFILDESLYHGNLGFVPLEEATEKDPEEFIV